MSFVKQVIYTAEQIEKDLQSALDAWEKLSEEERKKNPRWYSKHIEINWDAEPFKGQKESRFWSVVTNFGGKRGRPQIRFVEETNGNSIIPTDERDFNEMKKRNPNSKIKEKRDNNMLPDLQVRKWNARIETDGKNVWEYKKGADGKPIYPEDKSKSKLFAAAALYYRALSDEIKYQKQIKRIVSDDTKDGALPNAIYNDVLTIITPIKTEIKKGDNRGRARLNPFFQMKVAFNKDDASKGTQFLDKRKKFVKDGKQDFERAKTEDGSVINNDNIHKWIGFACPMGGLVVIDSICMSNMGISCQAKARMIISQPPERQTISASDIFDGDNDPELAGDNDEEEGSTKGDSSKAKDDNKKQDTDNIYQKNLTIMKQKN